MFLSQTPPVEATDFPVSIDTAKLKDCIAALHGCIASCHACAYEMAGNPKLAMSIANDCPKCCIDCADMCEMFVRALSRKSPYWQPYRTWCQVICEWCADQCGEHYEECCIECAEHCIKCVAALNELV
ncbi:hypothetical protein [Novipirellula artificiosorum]|uniref:Cysteine-rich protein YhjQ n=1 Tax=Novipirellula artificiosorum TaxID=2528016 RepID=A0A5C6DFY3_9BACT|nr:hypothetical protein [Novipirellula artificiosorum]TWU36193.1 hypothetical protein Poly41_39470 [Novipirellula artificiosorum]